MRRLLAGLGLGLLFPIVAAAANVAVMPVGLSLGGAHDREAITVTNQGQESVTMQVETVSWTQSDGDDHYEPTRDLLVNPPLFVVAPGQSQVLRVGLRRPSGGEREIAYRLFIREVPPAAALPLPSAEADGGQVRVLLELRLPVYSEPTKVVRAQRWQGRRTADGGIEVEVANTGNVHLVVAGLKLRAPDAAVDSPPLAAIKASASVFPGQHRRWELKPQPATSNQRFLLEVATDRGPQNVVLDLDRE